ncbi:uncharacterized protein SAMN05892883_1014 [Jatrophihabitans sp. GAS493]|uniref:DUF2252 domain-containing protein n=1 Tax=Jatrophihabitans sp. GAS493 TaxID=1907575 RepID=UPI000BB7E14D|nr:DUF2252 domain-containing protein [Jatrophihabitans sp. GAS493]SOD71497.1 uncharacterized protein SAMN05892883_1014 [Jatrophihabitans sp. GAS493]
MPIGWQPIVAERAAIGRGARRRVKRSALGPWSPATRREDALGVIRAQDATRLQSLIPIRHARMAVSPWTFYRGAAGVMAADLAATPHSGLEVQLCGDAHVLNFGLWATPERNLLFDLRDFDETLPGPFEWDVKRLAASIVVLARDNELPATTANEAVQATLRAYQRAIARYATAPELAVWYDRVDVGDLLGFFEVEDRARLDAFIQKQANRRTSTGAFDKLTELTDGSRRIVESPPFRVAIDDAVHLKTAREVIDSYRGSLQPHLWHLLNRFSYVDVVRQIVGVGSVGMQVYLVLLDGRGGSDDPLFLQLKQAGPSVYERYLKRSDTTNHGQRVVNGKRQLQTATDIFAGWATARGFDFYVRQFRDMKVIPDSHRIAPRLSQFATACGEVLARAHARSGDAVAIASYVGRGDAFTKALQGFAVSYADQNATDHVQLQRAIADGQLESALVF